MSERKRAADEYDFIRARLSEIRQEKGFVDDTSAADEDEDDSPGVTAAGNPIGSSADFTFQIDGVTGKTTIWANTRKAQDRAVDWTASPDGAYRKLKSNMADKLRNEGYSISHR